MSNRTLQLAVIVASVREGRFGPAVARWFREEARQHGQFAVDVIDLAETPLPLALPPVSPKNEANYPRPAGMAEVTATLAAADAFVVVTPEYNHSFPASIKALIDWHFTQWQAKPVGFVSYGGLGGGIRAVEQLRLVFAEMHAVGVRDTVSFANYWELFDAEGRLVEPEGPQGAAKIMLDQLVWWATALYHAQAENPYQVAG
ncbi:NADPH-dependent FMN reductase [Amycolatopsis anabasis]|uniref:NADPH-dependent FMN reductase n=1 Tax=Amycolatopsis anabasis TaxID=1840409 RepID=UPI00131E5DD5|nr:NAD(P)H-dependent oxidoreductase [Amycolatopsis anabasis]